MLKKKITSIVLAIAMLMGLSAVSVSASNTDAISAVLLDSTSYTQLENQYNKLVVSSYNVFKTAVHGENESDEKIGEDENCCLKFGLGDYGITSQSRFLLSKVALNANNPTATPTSSAFYIGQQTAVTYWSVDVYDNGAITDITMQVGGEAMHTKVTSADLTDNAWNTFSAVYYPNTKETTKCGYADFYLNGKFVETKDLSYISIVSEGNLSAMQTRFGFYFTDENAIAYFDNIKIYEMTSFTKPAPASATGITVEDSVISNYGRVTVSSLESTLGVEILAADGTAAADDATVVSGMKAVASNTITGVGTFKNGSYTFGEDGYTEVNEVVVDSTTYKGWGNGYNRIMLNTRGYNAEGTEVYFTGSDAQNINGDTNGSYVGQVVAAGKTNRWNLGKLLGTPNVSTTGGGAQAPNAATAPMYWSVDVYGEAIEKLQMCTDGNTPMAPVVTAAQLKANEWNTFALVYYPNTKDSTVLGYADFYLNNEYVGTTDLSNLPTASRGKEYRMVYYGTDTAKPVYFDNVKLYEMKSFVRPDITAGSVAITDGAITGYTTATVADLEAATGASIKTADGADAVDSATPVAGMKALTTSTVAGVGTFTNEYVLGAGGHKINDWSYTAESNLLNAELPVVNLTGEDLEFTVLVAEFDGERFVTATVVPTTINTVNGSAKIENLALAAGHTYKLLAWESITNLRPLKNVIEFTN